MTDHTPPPDVYRDQFEKLGNELLNNTNKPNVITFEQFRPYLPLFQKLEEEFQPRQKPNTPYQIRMSQLFMQYIRNLSINIYQPTIVIQSKEDPREIAWLDRIFTRIQPDLVPSHVKSNRDAVPGGVSRVSNVAREQQIMDASLLDLMNANATDEQAKFFDRVRTSSMLIRGKFMDNNMTPDQRALIEEAGIKAEESNVESSGEIMFGIVDDDD